MPALTLPVRGRTEFVATMKVELDLAAARTYLRLEEALEELDDVQNVFSNVEITPEVAAQLEDED